MCLRSSLYVSYFRGRICVCVGGGRGEVLWHMLVAQGILDCIPPFLEFIKDLHFLPSSGSCKFHGQILARAVS